MQTVKTDAIKVREGFNARAEANDLDGLKLSIKRDGILVPLIVKLDGDAVELIAGERRLRAAQLLELDEVPVVFQRDDHDEAVVHAVENMQRAQLSPVEEARAIKKVIDGGLTQDGAAEALGISKRLVSERLPLLDTPGSVQGAIASGAVSTRAVSAVVAMAKVSSKLAELAVGYVLADDSHRYGPGELVDDPAHVAAAAVAANGQGKHGLWAVGGNYDIPLERLKLPAEDQKRAERWLEGRYQSALPIAKEVIAEALSVGTAYGVVDENERGLWRTVAVICADQRTIRDYAVRTLDALEAEEERRKAEQAKWREESGLSEGGGTEKSDEERQEEAAERARARELLTEAREANLDLGVVLLDKLAKVKLDKNVATLVCHTVLREHSVFSGNAYESVASLAAKGLARVLPDWHEFEVPSKKDGSPGAPKVKYPKGDDELAKRFWRWFDQAKTPEEMLGRLVVALAAAEYAIPECAPRSQRPNFVMADTRGRAKKALEVIVKPVLPARVRKLRSELAKARG